jgi:hypothetical protein
MHAACSAAASPGSWRLTRSVPHALQVTYSSYEQQAAVEQGFKAAGVTIALDYWLGYTLVNSLWVGGDGLSGGDGTATNNTSSLYYHWAATNVDSQGAGGVNCARATSTGAYWFYSGSSTNYTQLKTTTFYNSSVTASNVYAWLATSCATTTLYAYICKMPLNSFV